MIIAIQKCVFCVKYFQRGGEFSEQKAKVLKRLLATTDYKEFRMNYSVEPELLGGMIIRINDRVVDSSIKTKLDKLAGDLKKIQLS